VRVPALHTDRLLIRELTAGDEDAARAVNDGLAPGWVAWTAETYAQLEALMQPPYGERAITLRETGELIGLLGLVPSYGPFDQIPGLGSSAQPARFRPEMGLYWALAPAYRGNGYATEAVSALVKTGFAIEGLSRIEIRCAPENTRSQHVPEKLGFKMENIVKRVLYEDTVETMIWSMTKKDYAVSPIRHVQIKPFDLTGTPLLFT